MAVTAVFTSVDSGSFTAFGVQDMAGQRLVIAVCDRSGGVSCSIATADAALTAALAQVAERVTLPGDGNSRRSVFLWEGIIPEGVSDNPVVTATVLDGGGASVAVSVVAAVAEEGEGYTLAGVSPGADSGTSTTASQPTGTTATVPAGDVLVIAAETTRGSTTAAWSTTDNTPPNPGGGDWNLSVTSGSGASQRRATIGYHSAAGAPSQTWADTVAYGTARMASALIAVWSAGSGGGEAHQGDGQACAAVLTPGPGAGSQAAAGTGEAASVTLTPGTGQGAPAASGSGQPASVTLAPGQGAGTSAVDGTGQPVTMLLIPDPGAGAGAGSGAGNGQPAEIIVNPGTGLGSPALVGAGQACTLILTPAPGTDVELVTPAGRTLIVPAENRTTDVAAEARLLTVSAAPRLLTVPTESRTLTVPEEDRRVVVPVVRA